MFHIEADNVNHAYYLGLKLMREQGVDSDSRNGKVKKLPRPVVTSYKYPHERVLFDKMRDANPFLHLFESIWMLGGRKDFDWLEQFTSKGRFAQFSDDGKTLHGAYGHRWREHFKIDQIDRAIFELFSNPSSRRVVIGMWDPYLDGPVAEVGGKDVPCNTQVLFNVRPSGELDMTVTNRSNDMIWGAYGANVVHMSILHEYVAVSAGIPMGTYYQLSNDFHMYERHFNLLSEVEYKDFYSEVGCGMDAEYAGAMFEPLLAPGQKSNFDKDVMDFLDAPWTATVYRTPFFTRTIGPMARAYKLYKAGFRASAVEVAGQIEAPDWRQACVEWIERRPQAKMSIV